MEKVFFILLAVAIIITVCLAVSAKREKKKASRAAPPEAERSTAPPQEQPSETPANVAVIYEGLRVRAAKHCTACGCEYDASVIACEICGQKL